MSNWTTTTSQDANGWHATITDGETTETCTHNHGGEKQAAGCGEWEIAGLLKGQSRWHRAPRGRKTFDNLRVAPVAGDAVTEDDLARSHEYVPMKDLVDLWHAVVTGASTRPAGNLLFIGPSGSGKTDGARYLAALVGLPLTKVDAASMTDPESWFGTRELIVQDGVAVTEYQPSSFVQAIAQPGIVLIDEVTRVRDEHRNVLLPLLDATRQVMNPLTGEIVYRHPKCFLIMAGNVGIHFTGTNAIDPAFMTRALTVEFDYIDAENEQRIVVDASGCSTDDAFVFVRFATETRAKAASDPEFLPLSTRELIEAGRLVKDGLTRDLAVKFVVLNAASGEGGSSSIRQELQNIWNGIRALKPNTNAGAAPASSGSWVCPVHGDAKDIPAGVSTKTGRPYHAFRACKVFGCQNTSDRTASVAPVNGTVLCPDCNTPVPAGRSAYCPSCGASLQ